LIVEEKAACHSKDNVARLRLEAGAVAATSAVCELVSSRQTLAAHTSHVVYASPFR
jgi:hypothetical protein